MKDVLVVGSGIAACSLAWQLEQLGKTTVMLSDLKKGSSAVAAGVYNPMVLKRFTAVWKAQEQLEQLEQLLQFVSTKTAIDYRYSIPVARRFHDQKECDTWLNKSQREDLKPFMQADIQHLDIDGITAAHGYGLVNHTGWLDTIAFMNDTFDYFKSTKAVLEESFDHDELLFHDDSSISYKDNHYKHIVFCEGYRMFENPYFNYLPLKGNKGEVLVVRIPGFKLDYIIKSSVFLMPYKDDFFWVGATYDRDDLSDTPTTKGREFLTSRLERFLNRPYEIIDHKHGIRPTTIDRRPFVGRCNDKNCWIFNGMGSRAVLIAPWAAKQLCNHIYHQQDLHPEIDIKRFTT